MATPQGVECFTAQQAISSLNSLTTFQHKSISLKLLKDNSLPPKISKSFIAPFSVVET